MHCASCERVIATRLHQLVGVEEVEVSLAKKEAGVRLHDDAPEPPIVLVNDDLAHHGYRLIDRNDTSERTTCAIPSQSKANRWHRFGEAALAIIAMILLLRLGQPLARFVPAVSASGSVLALFLFGLVASVSTCLASTGAFLLGYATETPSRSKMVMVHGGRLLAFGIGGGILGALGGSLPANSMISALISFLLGFGFLGVSLHLLGITPSLASIGLRLPSSIARIADRVSAKRFAVSPVWIGVVTFFLPCGFTQTAQALALASGSALRGMFIMLAFGLGTLPVLLGITTFGSVATFRHRWMRLATGALIFFFAFGQIDGALTMIGSPMTIGGLVSAGFSRTTQSVIARPANAEEQIVSMTVAYGAFTPNRFTVKRGVPVRWEVNGADISGCASTIVSPKIGVRASLVPGLNVITFTPEHAGEIPFSCSMGMIRGSFQVLN